MTSIDILVIGHLGRDVSGAVIPSETWSTSALVRTDDGHNIVIDTSQEYMRAGIKTSFRQIGKIFPDDVDIVLLTHSHPDHVGNVGMFRNAEVYKFSGGEFMDGVSVLETEKEIARGVRFVRTPGHSDDSGSVFVDADRNYAFAGDAVPLQDNLAKKAVPALNTDPEKAAESMRRIARYADVVIPGHGKPFNVGSLKRLYK